MILYKKSFPDNKIERASKTMDIVLDELPERPIAKFSTPKERERYIKTCEQVIRGSLEYKELIKFLKNNCDMNQCIVLKQVINGNGKRYRIELHHEPFTLFDIVETVIQKRIELGEVYNTMRVADEVMELHYRGLVGLIPLSVTAHELVHNGRIFIPLQYVYQQYNVFYNEYHEYMNPMLIEKIEAKVDLSMANQNIVSDALTPEFTYLNVSGFEFPVVPDEWKELLIS